VGIGPHADRREGKTTLGVGGPNIRPGKEELVVGGFDSGSLSVAPFSEVREVG
jgi:hypothetical protein